MPKNDKIPTDLVDDLRSNLNKIGKLAPDLDAWRREYEAEMSRGMEAGELIKIKANAEQVHAALAVMSTIEEMRRTLQALRHFTIQVSYAKIEQDKAAQDAFFDRVDE